MELSSVVKWILPLAHWSLEFFDLVVLSMMLNCHEKMHLSFKKCICSQKSQINYYLVTIIYIRSNFLYFFLNFMRFFAHTVHAFLPFCILALLWFYWTVLTPASTATFLCNLTWLSLCFHIFLQNNFGADISKTIFNPLIQRLMYVQTTSCTKRNTASIKFFFGSFTLPLSYM